MKIRIYNNTLNPDLWLNSNTLKPDVRESLLKIAKDFYTETELSAPIEDIYMLGSSANYNWSPTSDIDLHVVIDFKKINSDVDLTKQLVDALKSNWNKNHNVSIKGRKVEVYIQDINERNRSTGVYSVMNNKWVLMPQKIRVVLDKKLIQQKYTNMVFQIKSAIKEQNLDKLKLVLKSLYNMREAGLSKTGEYSTENIVFKALRSRGFVDSLKNTVNKLYDSQVSVKQEDIKNNK
jgi:predicted nucleotidyltransferase